MTDPIAIGRTINRVLRVIAGFIIAPLAGTTIYLVLTRIHAGWNSLDDLAFFDTLTTELWARMPAIYLVVLPVMTIFYLYAIAYFYRRLLTLAVAGAAIAYPMASWFSDGEVPIYAIVIAWISGFLAGMVFWLIAEFGYERTPAAH